MNYLRLIRFSNLALIIAVQILVKYCYLIPVEAVITLSNLGFAFLIIATVLIAAGGYILNDIYDVTADKINKPNKRIVDKSIATSQARLLYYILSFSGIGFGFVLSNMIGIPSYFLLFIVPAILLYIYARFLKKTPFVGNVLISLLVMLSILLVGIFELLPSIDSSNEPLQLGYFTALLHFAIFAGIVNLLRELVKDVEDIQGDHVARYKTLPVLLGAARTAQFTAILGLVLIAILSFYSFTFLYAYKWALAYTLFAIIAPIGYVSNKLWEANKKSDFTRLSFILKIIFVMGILAIPLFTYIIQNAR